LRETRWPFEPARSERGADRARRNERRHPAGMVARRKSDRVLAEEGPARLRRDVDQHQASVRPPPVRQALICACVAVGCWLAHPAAQVVFRAGVDLVEVDAAVVGADGRPILGLTSADFVLRVDGQPRAIESVDYINAVATSPNDSPSSSTET